MRGLQALIICFATFAIFENVLATTPPGSTSGTFKIRSDRVKNLCIEASPKLCDGLLEVRLQTCAALPGNFLQEFKFFEDTAVANKWHITIKRNETVHLKYNSDTVLSAKGYDCTEADTETNKYKFTFAETSSGSRKWIISAVIGGATKYLVTDGTPAEGEALAFSGTAPTLNSAPWNIWTIDESVTCSY